MTNPFSSGDVGLYPAVSMSTHSGDDNPMQALQRSRDRLKKRVEMEEVIIGPYDCKFRLRKLVNGGSFGQIFLGENNTTGETVAIKIEHSGQIEQLLAEGQVYRKLQGGPGIPKVYWYGMHGSAFNAMVMELLGPSLQDLFLEAERKFSLKTVLLLIDQMIDTIHFVHHQGFVHRDISTNNFMMGVGPENAHKLHLIDFGLAKKMQVPNFCAAKRRISYNFARPMVGTGRFCSITCQRGEEEARRDDMESLGYLWIYMLKGRLPWQGLKASCSVEKMALVLKCKQSTPLAVLCEGLPNEFLTYMSFVRDMKQYDSPNYAAIKSLFAGCAKAQRIDYDFLYDWSEMTNVGLCEGDGSAIGSVMNEEEETGSMQELGDLDANGQYLRGPRTVSMCSGSSPSDGTASH